MEIYVRDVVFGVRFGVVLLGVVVVLFEFVRLRASGFVSLLRVIIR